MPIGIAVSPGRGSPRWWPRAALACGFFVLSACSAITHPPAAQAPVTQAPALAGDTPQARSSPSTPRARWQLTWSDGFSGQASLRKWNFIVSGYGGNLKQLQWYDGRNAAVSSTGDLVITASKGGGGHTCWYGPCRYTSVRMNTLGTFAQAYGRFEARIKFPPGRGLWPAFWLEGADVTTVGWPAAGEIDVVEPDGKHQTLLQSFAHAPNQGARNALTMPTPLSAGFHVYGVDWSPLEVTWWVDGNVYAHMKYYPGWPYNHPFFLILNLAVGGGYPGPPDAQTSFPARMLVDWVRVYRQIS